MRQRLLEHWNSYLEACKLQNAHPIQKAEMRNAFYAGSIATLKILTGAGAEPSVIDELQDELDRYLENYKREHNLT